MRTEKWIKLEELRQPGIRRVLDAMTAVEQERPGLVEEAAFAARQLAKNRREGGGLPE